LVASLEERDDASRLIATSASGESVGGLGRRANESYGFEFAMRSLVKLASLEERDDASRLIATCASGESVGGLGRRANEPYGFEFAMRSLVKLATLTGLLP